MIYFGLAHLLVYYFLLFLSWLKQLIVTKIPNIYDKLWFYYENKTIFNVVLEYKFEKKG